MAGDFHLNPLKQQILEINKIFKKVTSFCRIIAEIKFGKSFQNFLSLYKYSELTFDYIS